mgnify:FL=1|jgi:hypothetical protein
MGIVFRDDYDDQQDSLLTSIAIGNTWQFRIYRVKAIIWGSISTATGIGLTLVTDYLVYKWTDHSGVLGWLLG